VADACVGEGGRKGGREERRSEMNEKKEEDM